MKAALLTFVLCSPLWITYQLYAQEKPNIVVIMADDLGYGDLGCFGATTIATPRIDELGAGGMKFTDFYVSSRCSPTRLGFMTGSAPARAGWGKVIYRRDGVGIHSDEVTVAELLQDAGYSTGIVGKWHLGEYPKFNPTRHGFDFFYGFMHCGGEDGKDEGEEAIFLNEACVELIRNKTDGIHSPKLLAAGKRFIQENADNPFFLFYASPLPHLKWVPHENFDGKSEHGVYGDVVEELDWQVGELLDHLRALKLLDNTLILFLSDNGPILSRDGHGSAGPLLGGKGSSLEGGIRVPCIFYWPAAIPAGSSNDSVASVWDLLPTFCDLAGIALPSDRVLDGRSLVPLFQGDAAASKGRFLVPGAAIRVGDWKLITSSQTLGGGKNSRFKLPDGSTDYAVVAGALFNLKEDPGETTDVVTQYPEKAAELRSAMDAFLSDLEQNSREIGRVEE